MNKRWKKFNALGSEVIIVANLRADQTRLLDQAERLVLDFEQQFSRFIKSSELSRFNDFSGGEIKVSQTMAELLLEAGKANRLTGAIFDPTIIGSLEAIGYDRKFDEIVPAPDSRKVTDIAKVRKNFLRRSPFTQLKIKGEKVFKPSGLRLDFGGLGKGYIVDSLINGLFAKVSDCWISAGGDLAVRGSDQAAVGWKIGVQDPNLPDREIFSVWTKGDSCGIATSGIHKRKGGLGKASWHHLIDPRTGLPAENNILAVTAISTDAMRADVLAKTVLILGEDLGLKFIERQKDSAAIIFFKDGGMVFSKSALKYIKRE